MKKILFLMLFIAFNAKAQKANDVHELDAKLFKEQTEQSKNVQLIDVRAPYEMQSGYLKGARNLNIDDTDFNQKLNLLNKELPVYVYCVSGRRSEKAARQMLNQGFKEVYTLSGGIKKWLSNDYETSLDYIAVKDLTLKQYQSILKTEKPVLVSFFNAQCNNCEQLNKDLVAKAAHMQKDLILLRIDTELNQQLADELGIKSVPAIRLYNKQKEVWQANGKIKLKRLDQQLKKIISEK
ncbi:rhodanese-like domain-containing protein [Pedobacter montanisoli]|uniref:Thioredoxin domain-containing protein n=1 Tax=Pedobacter montanisoli TaxID=2923277 RepID=A0ABS9ZZL8_9SPHI|nr:rhodanese-like domain-containing protein [Pedobacter montanisoli]MCJ0743748.1 thioredoxin domain-containing protein [Pedobacter montanisoli]